MAVSIAERLAGEQDVIPGKNYLSLAELVDLDRKQQFKRTRPEFDEVQDTLDKVVGGHVPDLLIEKMGFDKLHWYGLSHPDALSALFIGVREAGHLRYEVDQAHGAIEITRQKWGRISGPSYIGASSVKVSGVYIDRAKLKGPARPAAFQYRTESDGKNTIRKVVAGVTQSELSDTWRRTTTRLSLDIPTVPSSEIDDHPRKEAGLITQEMIDYVDSMTMISMNRAVGFNAYPDCIYPNELAHDQGFHGAIINGELGIAGYQLQGSERYRYMRSEDHKPSAWAIMVPLYLASSK